MDILKAAQSLLDAARAKKRQITVAESCTGGLLAGAITEVAGSSDIFQRGFVTYSNEAKVDMLRVRKTTLLAHGAVSEQVALEMAQGALNSAKADVALSITGIAGPGGSDNKPEGRVCFAIAQSDGPDRSETIDFGPLGRAQVRRASVEHGLAMILDRLS